MLKIYTIPKLNECKFKIKKLFYKFGKQLKWTWHILEKLLEKHQEEMLVIKFSNSVRQLMQHFIDNGNQHTSKTKWKVHKHT